MSNEAVASANITELPDRITYQDEVCLVPELSLIGWTRFVHAGELASHQHRSYEICYISQGQVTWTVESKEYDVHRGELFVTKPGVVHSGLNNTMHPCEIRWLHINLPANGLALPGLSLSETAQLKADFEAIEHPCFPGTTAIKRNLIRILAEHQTPSSYAVPLVRLYLQQLLIQVAQAYAAYRRSRMSRPAPASHPICQALQWMETHLTETYQVEDLARVASMSVSQFHRQFLEETGFRPAEYRTRQRLLKAKQWLVESDRPILEIAYDLGFSTGQYFATVFKKFEGVTPCEYRERFGRQHHVSA